MATLVVLKTSLSAPTASFFAALSTASFLRLAAFATAGPPGCTHRPAQNLTSGLKVPRTRRARRHLKPALPNLMARGVEVRTKLASHRQQTTRSENPVFTRLCRPCD